MPVQVPDIEPLSADQIPAAAFQRGLSGMQGYMQNAINMPYQNQILRAQAQYAPYNQYADAQLKQAQAQYMPLQYMATPLGNPLFIAQLSQTPGALQNYMQRFSNVAQGANGMNLPMPNAQGSSPSLWSKISANLHDTFGSGNDSNPTANASIPQYLQDSTGNQGQPVTDDNGQPINQQPPSSTPNTLSQSLDTTYPQQNDQSASGYDDNAPALPASDGSSAPSSGGMPNIMQGAVRNALAPYTANIETGKGKGVGEGTTYVDPTTGQTYSSLTTKDAGQAQTSIAAMQRLMPTLNRVSSEAQPFQTYGGMAKYLGQTLTNPISNNPSGQLPTQKAKLDADLSLAPESYLKAYGINPTDQNLLAMKDVVAPKWGESGSQYAQRIQTTLQQLKAEELASAQQNLQKGVPLDNSGRGGYQPQYAGPPVASLPQQSVAGPTVNPNAPIPASLPRTSPTMQAAMAPPTGMIRMRHPDGRTGMVPASQAQNAIAQGFTRIN